SSFLRQLDVELLPTFAPIGTVVKLSVRRAEVKRLGIQRVYRKAVPSDDIERMNLSGDFLKTRPVIRALVYRAFVFRIARRSRRGSSKNNSAIVRMKNHRAKIFFHPVAAIDPAPASAAVVTAIESVSGRNENAVRIMRRDPHHVTILVNSGNAAYRPKSFGFS